MIIGCAASDTARRLPPDVSFGTIGEQAHLERGCRCDRLKSRGKNPSPWLATVALLMVTGHLTEAPFSSTGGGWPPPRTGGLCAGPKPREPETLKRQGSLSLSPIDDLEHHAPSKHFGF